MNSNAEAGKPHLAISANLKASGVENQSVAAPTFLQGAKSRLKLDFRRSPDVIFAVGVGIIAIYYAGLGLLKLVQLLAR